MTEHTALIVRELTGSDAAAFQAVRLRSLKEHPTAFGSDYDYEKTIPLEKTIEHLSQRNAERFILGAFLDGELIGIIAGNRDSHRKSQHRAHIGAMYVSTRSTRQRGWSAAFGRNRQPSAGDRRNRRHYPRGDRGE